LGLIVVRAVAYKPVETHYHANFALYINGQKDEFKSFTFYEEIQACSDHNADNVKGHAHMHDQNNHLIHIHAAGVTWGDFFANLGYGLTDKAVVTDGGMFASSENNKLTFTLNGQPVSAIANNVIHSEDVLLINYGNDNNQTLQNRYNEITRDAYQANTTKDPATCSGSHEVTFMERLRHAIGIVPGTAE
jgi:hypothetical protein